MNRFDRDKLYTNAEIADMLAKAQGMGIDLDGCEMLHLTLAEVERLVNQQQ